MARNGSGTYVRTNGVNTGSTTWTTDRNQGATILAGRHDTHDQDIADALTQSISADGQTTITANLPMSTFRHTGVGAGVAATDYARLDQAQSSSTIWGGNSTGAANVYACSLTPAISSYTGGLQLAFFAHQDNTGAATLNINGLGATNILSREGFTLVPYSIKTSTVVHVVYNSSAFYLLSQTPIFQGYQAAAAAGTTQGTATAITSSFFVATSAVLGASDGVRLPAGKRGMKIFVCMADPGSADAINVYPASGEQIVGYGVNGPIVISNSSNDRIRMLVCMTDGEWYMFKNDL